jgi:hypothetical protein
VAFFSPFLRTVSMETYFSDTRGCDMGASCHG